MVMNKDISMAFNIKREKSSDLYLNFASQHWESHYHSDDLNIESLGNE